MKNHEWVDGILPEYVELTKRFIDYMSGGFGGPGGSDNSGEKPSGGFGGPSSSGDSSAMSGGPSGGTDSSSYHMASFDYAYNCAAVIERLFQ